MTTKPKSPEEWVSKELIERVGAAVFASATPTKDIRAHIAATIRTAVEAETERCAALFEPWECDCVQVCECNDEQRAARIRSRSTTGEES